MLLLLLLLCLFTRAAARALRTCMCCCCSQCRCRQSRGAKDSSLGTTRSRQVLHVPYVHLAGCRHPICVPIRQYTHPVTLVWMVFDVIRCLLCLQGTIRLAVVLARLTNLGDHAWRSMENAARVSRLSVYITH